MKKGFRILFFLGVFLIQFDTVAQITWQWAYGALGNDQCLAFRAAADDKYIAVGNSGSFGSSGNDIYIMELNLLGERNWSNRISGNEIKYAADMVVSNNGDLLIVGITNETVNAGYDGILIRTDNVGNVIWQRTYGGSDWDRFYEVEELENGNLLIVGQTFSYGDPGGKAWLMQTDNNGELIWQRFYGSSDSYSGRSLCLSSSGDIAVVGSFPTNNGDIDTFVALYNLEGDLIWDYNYGGIGDDIGCDIISTQDDGFSIVGSTSSYSSFVEAWHFKIHNDGEEDWIWNWGQINDQEAFEHVQLETGEFISIGYTKTTGAGGKDFFLLKSNYDGSFDYGQTFGGAENDEGFSLDLLVDGVICGGYTRSYGAGGEDFFLLRADLNIQTETVFVDEGFDPVSTDEIPKIELKISTYPNPSSGKFTVEGVESIESAVLYDVTGRLVQGLDLISSPLFAIDNLSSGTYVLRVIAKGMEVFETPILIIDP